MYPENPGSKAPFRSPHRSPIRSAPSPSPRWRTGNSVIRNPLWSGDTEAAVLCYRAFGARIDTADDKAWKVTGLGGKVTPPRETIDVLNSGTTLRVAMGSAALAEPDAATTFTGDEQIQSRPIAPLMQSLEELGAKCVSLKNNGKAPVRVSGGLRGGRTSIAAFTSQYLSSLLLCTPLAPADTDIEVTLLNEPGYVQMTLDWLDKQGIQYEHDGLRRFHMRGGQSYKAYDLPVPADFSSATFFLCAAALFGDGVTLQGPRFLRQPAGQGGRRLPPRHGRDIVTGPGRHHRQGLLAQGHHHRHERHARRPAGDGGHRRLRRGHDQAGQRAPGPQQGDRPHQVHGRGTHENGGQGRRTARRARRTHSKLKAAHLDGRSDHRIVMAMSLAAMGLDKPCTIETAEAIKVTFPEFVGLMQALGGNMEIKGS